MSINIDRDSLWAGLNPFGTLDTDVNFLMLYLAGKVTHRGISLGQAGGAMYSQIYTDKAIFTTYNFAGGVSTGGMYEVGRLHRTNTARKYYYVRQEPAAATADRKIVKHIEGSETIIATQAEDYDGWMKRDVTFQCNGTLLTVYEHLSQGAYYVDETWTDVKNNRTQKLSTTDTDIASGRFGIQNYTDCWHEDTSADEYLMPTWTVLFHTWLYNPMSEFTLERVAFFEVPIEGSGKMPSEDKLPVMIYDADEYNAMIDPFRPVVPEDIVEIEKPVPNKMLERKIEVLKAKGWTTEEIKAFMPEAFPVERINRLAMSWSAFIPTDSFGKPKHGTAILRIFRSTPEYVYPMEKRIQALREIRGVRELKPEEAIDLALKMDDRLHIHDLVPCVKHDLGGKCWQEYHQWRLDTYGLKEEIIDPQLKFDVEKRYVKESKGWS